MNDQPDILFEPDFVGDADGLFAALLAGTEWDERMQARLTASFGKPYNYSGMTYPEVPLPEPLSLLCDAVNERVGFRPNNCLVNYYPSGESTMGFHADSIAELDPGSGVAVVSLGAERVLRFRRIDDKSVIFDCSLPHGSLLYMPPEVQLSWKHGVPAQASAGKRISVTLRRLRESEVQ